MRGADVGKQNMLQNTYTTENLWHQRLIAELKQKESREEERLKVLEVKKGKVGFDMGLKVLFYVFLCDVAVVKSAELELTWYTRCLDRFCLHRHRYT